MATAATAKVTPIKPDVTSDQPYRERIIYEGVYYELESINAREFNQIEEEATVTEFDEDTGAKRKVLDGKMQMDKLMRKMLIAGMPKGGPDRLPIRHYTNLRQRINELCFGVLPNSFKPADEDDEIEEEGEPKGEG